MSAFRLRLRSGPRLPRFPRSDDDALGLAAWKMLEDAVRAGRAGPGLLVLTPDQVYAADLRPVVADPRVLHRAIATLASLEGAEAVALLGVLTRRKVGLPAWPFAVAFLEWPDGRWWLAHRRVLQGGGFAPAFDVETQRAVDDLPRPGGLGGWFTRARVEGLRARLTPVETELVN